MSDLELITKRLAIRCAPLEVTPDFFSLVSDGIRLLHKDNFLCRVLPYEPLMQWSGIGRKEGCPILMRWD